MTVSTPFADQRRSPATPAPLSPP